MTELAFFTIKKFSLQFAGGFHGTQLAMYIPRLSICLFSWTVTVFYCAAMLEEDEHYDEQI